MGKRSDFARRPMDDYRTTDPRARSALEPFLLAHSILYFAEPCSGELDLIKILPLRCVYEGDIKRGQDALDWHGEGYGRIDAIITNPPWTRKILHPMILHFQKIAPTWLLFDADWCQNRQAAPYLDQCSHIVAVGRLKWFVDSQHSGKDNVCWYRFHHEHTGGPHFYGRRA